MEEKDCDGEMHKETFEDHAQGCHVGRMLMHFNPIAI